MGVVRNSYTDHAEETGSGYVYHHVAEAVKHRSSPKVARPEYGRLASQGAAYHVP